MPDKKPGDRGVADSIANLRHMRYMTKGPGQFERKRAKPLPAPSIAKLRNDVAKVAKKAVKKKPKKRSRR
jgi:hypothetical protein